SCVSSSEPSSRPSRLETPLEPGAAASSSRTTLQRCLEDPVETILGEQPNVAALALDAQPVAILFDFVDPVGARRYHLGGGR
ncbi:hypothetical protein ABIA85_010026, partial [Bradyrhizobium sp. LA6.10]|uniref:hypothetical protein n=1 Tax=Bradyrhizobium sp. LA6.10 TaxID=3156318 RepID=UPI00339595C5